MKKTPPEKKVLGPQKNMPVQHQTSGGRTGCLEEGNSPYFRRMFPKTIPFKLHQVLAGFSRFADSSLEEIRRELQMMKSFGSKEAMRKKHLKQT